MDKFEEYFRTTKHYENMLLDIARNQLPVSVFDKNGRKYRNHIVQISYEVFQHQQAKVEELQKRVAELELLLERIHRYGLDAYNGSTCMTIRDELEQALKGEG